jgi:1-acyl-sn-glycerol-3-phosphate acyltransferase
VRERFEVGGIVDVEAQRVVAHDTNVEAAAAGLRRVAGARAGAVGEHEVGRCGYRQHRIAVVVMIGHDHRNGRGRIVGNAVERRRQGKICVHHDHPDKALIANPLASRLRGKVERPGVVDGCEPEGSGPRHDFRRARHDDDGSRRGGGNDALGHRAREQSARFVVEGVREAGLAPGKRPQRNHDACCVGKAPGRHGLRMLPTVDPVYSVAKGVFSPWLRWGLRWTIEGAHNIPLSGPVVLASNHVSYLDPLTLAWVADRRGRHVRYLAKAELFEKPALGTLLRAAHQIPVSRGRADAADALETAVESLRRGECIGVFPEGTISEDLEPMIAKSGTARLVRRAGVAITPVGLWGTHRILTKGRKPHWQWGVEQTAVIGEPIVPKPDEHMKQTTDRMMTAIIECVARARELYPAVEPGEPPWWWRGPETASSHRRTA